MATLEERLGALEKENTEIKRRLSTPEGQFEFISGQLRTLQLYVHDRFDQIDARFDRVDPRLDRVEGRIGKVETEVGSLRCELSALRSDIPAMTADAMREVLRERDAGGR